MKLFELWPIHPTKGAWDPWYDTACGFVVRAETEEAARCLADAKGGDETSQIRHPWLDPGQSKCEELLAEGEAEVILRHFDAA